MSARILIIQMAKLGDFIQSTPLLANVRREYPEAEIVLACEQGSVAEAADLSPLVDEVLVVKDNGPVPSGRFEAVFVLNSHSRAASLADSVKARHHYGPRLREGRLHFTAAQNFLISLMMTGNRARGRFNLADIWASLCPGASPEPLFWPKPCAPSELLNEAAGLKIGFQLGSKNHLRRWPVEYFAELAARLNGYETATAVLLGSGPEKAMGARFEKLAAGQARVINLMGRTSLEELGAVLSGLDLLVTADTGVMHLAAAVGIPVLALFFGPAYGPETGPYGEGHLIYQALADCAPCRENDKCPRRQCLEMPLPAIAAEAARLRLGRVGDLPALPQGHRVWRTGSDNFGQKLETIGRPPLTNDEALALLITEAGRPLIRGGYRADAAQFRAALECFEQRGPVTINEAVLKKLAAASPGPEHGGDDFLTTARSFCEDLGFNFAVT
ncbi:hypothetical protein C4J81_13060 [Deltaproteobacteria bacterium Smac51]|nr:hypothetical protein C4J81_13060 [Deltaproteobacteria bacterium Smac51]